MIIAGMLFISSSRAPILDVLVVPQNFLQSFEGQIPFLQPLPFRLDLFLMMERVLHYKFNLGTISTRSLETVGVGTDLGMSQET